MSISAIEEEQETVSAINSTQIQTASLTRKLKQKKTSFRKEWLTMKEYSSWLQEVKNDTTQARCRILIFRMLIFRNLFCFDKIC